MIDPTAGNVGEWRGVCRQGELFAEYQLLDSLPYPIRMAIKDAPYDYSVSDIANAYRQSYGEFNWDTMSYGNIYPVDFARQMVGNFQKDVIRNSLTKAERNGAYWLKKHSAAKLTLRRRRAILRVANAIMPPRSIT